MKTVDDSLEDYGVPETILESLSDASLAELVKFVETAADDRDRHALTAWLVNEGFPDKERAIQGFYTTYEDTYEVEEDFVRSYFSNRLEMPQEALDFIDVDKAYAYLVEREDAMFYRLELGGNTKSFAIFEKSPRN